MNAYKKDNIVIVIVVAIFLLLVSGLIYNFYFKDYGEYNKTQEKKESIFVDINDESVINELLSTIKINNLKDVAAFEKDIDNINALEPIEKINIAYNAIKINDNVLELDVLELDTYFKNSFKTTIYWDKSDIYCVNGEILYKFDISSNKYIYNVEHNCEKHNEINTAYTKVLSAKKKNNIYIITVNYAWNNSEQPDTIYSSYKDVINKNNVLSIIPSEDGIVSFDMISNYVTNVYDNIKDELHKYTYIFEKSNNKYLLVSFKYDS